MVLDLKIPPSQDLFNKPHKQPLWDAKICRLLSIPDLLQSSKWSKNTLIMISKFFSQNLFYKPHK